MSILPNCSYADPETAARKLLYIPRSNEPICRPLTGDIAFFWTLMRKESDNLVILPVTWRPPQEAAAMTEPKRPRGTRTSVTVFASSLAH